MKSTSSATSRAYDVLKAKILNAELAPNQQILEADLAQLLGMSRTPVREACIRLQSDGLVEVVPRQGVRIVPISAKDMAEVYDVVAIIEARAAELAASRSLGAEELAPLEQAVNEMTLALEANDLDAWAAADSDFHHALVVCSGNRHLVAAAMQFLDRVHRARLITLRLRPIPIQSAKDHAELLALIQVGDADGAHALHLAHRRDVAEQLIDLFEHHRLGGL